MTADDVSAFSGPLDRVTSQKQLYLNGSTCQTYIVRVYGKLHFKKQLKAEYKGMPQYVEAFRKEFEVGYRLNHPALPCYVALGDEDGCPYILEEYIDGKLWEPSFDIFLIGRLLQECRVPHIYNKVIAKCLKDDPRERYDSVDSMKKAIGALRRRLTFYKVSMVVTVVACLAAVLSLLIPAGPKELRPQETTEKTETSQPLRAPEGVLTAKGARQTKMMEPTPSLRANNGKAETTTAEALMSRELQQNMDVAYKKYIAPLPKDSLRDVDCLNKHIAMYMDCVNSEIRRLKNKYTDLQPQTIDTRFAEIYSRTVMPIVESCGSEK